MIAKEKEIRQKALKVLSKVRRKRATFSRACKSEENKISPILVLKHTNAFKEVKRKWVAKKFDKISRRLAINENGVEIYITTNDSRHASTIGKYHNAIKKFLESGDPTFLEPYKNKKIKDKSGVWHILDTNPDNIYQIMEMREMEEFWEIYSE